MLLSRPERLGATGLRILAAVLSLVAAPAAAATFTAAEMMKLQRISDPHVSPDGTRVLYTATAVDLAGNSRNNELWMVPLAGGEPRRLTSHPGSDTRGRFSPDGRRIAFVSTRGGAAQVYVMDAAGGEPRPATSLPTGAGGVLWIDADTLLVTSDVYPECDAPTGVYDAGCNQKRLEAGARRAQPRVYDELLYRHWDTWEDGRRTHLLAVPLGGGAVRDLTPGARDVPPFSLGGPDDYAVSPDGREIAFVRNDDGPGHLGPTRTCSWSRWRAGPRARSPAAPATMARPPTARTGLSWPSARRCAPGTSPTAGACSCTTAARAKCGT